MNEALENPRQILRMREICQLTTFSRSTIVRKIANGTFPRPFRLSEKILGWRRGTVERWLENRPMA